MRISISIPIDEGRLADMIITALDGGIGYWCREVRLFVDNKRVYGTDSLPENLIRRVIIRFVEDDTNKIYDLNLMNGQAARKGLENMPNRQLNDFLNEDDDAVTASSFIQTCLFGEIRYG